MKTPLQIMARRAARRLASDSAHIPVIEGEILKAFPASVHRCACWRMVGIKYHGCRCEVCQNEVKVHRN